MHLSCNDDFCSATIQIRKVIQPLFIGSRYLMLLQFLSASFCPPLLNFINVFLYLVSLNKEGSTASSCC